MKNILIILLSLIGFNTGIVCAQNPYTDPNNTGGWALNPAVSDEFEATILDEDKWLIQGTDGVYHANWKGRAPSHFSPDNTRMEDGKLILETRWEPDFPFPDELQDGNAYENITCAAVISKETFLFGYMEIKCKTVDASVVSAFWMTGEDAELDVFENNGRPSGAGKEKLESEFWNSIHHWGKSGGPSVWTSKKQLDFKMADDFHVYGCEWDPDFIKIYADDRLVSSIRREDMGENWVTKSPLNVWVDNETFPWHGLPTEEDLETPGEFQIEYIRIWQKDYNPSTSVRSVALSNPTLKMQVNQKGYLKAKITPHNASNQNVTWSSSNTSIATVSTSGMVKAITNGTATITAKTEDGNKTATCRITVQAATNYNLVRNGGFELEGFDLWDKYSTNNGQVQVVSNNAKSGNKALYFGSNGNIGQYVRVEPNTVYSISAWAQMGDADQEIIVKANEHGGQNATIKFSDTNYDKKTRYITTGPDNYSTYIYAWLANANHSAYIDDITIVAYDNNSDKILATSLNIHKTTLALKPQETEMLCVLFSPVSTTDRRFVWSSDNRSVATVNETGVVTAIGEGQANITVRSLDGSNKTATCLVTVATAEGEAIEMIEVNDILNPSFETGTFDSWYTSGSTAIESSSTASDDHAAMINGAGQISQFITLQPNTIYTISCQGKVADNGQRIYWGISNHSTGNAVKNYWFESTTYEKGSITFTTGEADTCEYKIWVWNNQGGGYYIDDFKIMKEKKEDDNTKLHDNKTAEISTSPMPFTTEVRIDAKDINHITIFDLSGRIIITQTKPGNQISMPSYQLMPRGVYILEISGIGIHARQKIIRE